MWYVCWIEKGSIYVHWSRSGTYDKAYAEKEAARLNAIYPDIHYFVQRMKEE